jgi:hypothetical protein
MRGRNFIKIAFSVLAANYLFAKVANLTRNLVIWPRHVVTNAFSIPDASS